MKRVAPFAALLCSISTASLAAPVCTLLVDADSGAVLRQDGRCDQRNSPASTFKVALSVMGYDAGILTDAHSPVWPYREEYKAWRENWKTNVDPASWMRDSVVWYSWGITRALGAQRLQQYVDLFSYGNRDLSGNAGKDDGLTHAWLSASLQISPIEEVVFLRRLLKLQLPASAPAQEKAIAIIPRFAAADGWTVQGKTGAGFQRGQDGVLDEDRQFGWFVGWAIKGDRRVVFARLTKDETKVAESAGIRTRDLFLAELPALLGNFAGAQNPN
ncbi:class D beta-lactamase [Methylocella tundrae]